MKLKDQIAIVTGATSGLGMAIAHRFAEEGAKVVVVGRNEERGKQVVEDIAAKAGKAVFVRCDVTKEEDVKSLVKLVETEFGTLHIVVNNAGVMIPGSVAELSLSDWEKTFQTNVTSAYLVSHYALPLLLKNGSGSIIHIASEAGLKGFKQRAAYCSAKSAMIGLTKAMAVDHSPYGIRVNCICPGTILTPLVERALENHPEPDKLMEEFLQRRLTPALGTPEQIAEAALYMALPENTYLTGAILSIDGGALAK